MKPESSAIQTKMEPVEARQRLEKAMTVYCRQLEDKSGFGVFVGTAKENRAAAPNRGGRPRWEQCVGVGITRRAAWKDYKSHNEAA